MRVIATAAASLALWSGVARADELVTSFVVGWALTGPGMADYVGTLTMYPSENDCVDVAAKWGRDRSGVACVKVAGMVSISSKETLKHMTPQKAKQCAELLKQAMSPSSVDKK
jgi:hypothetical protein